MHQLFNLTGKNYFAYLYAPAMQSTLHLIRSLIYIDVNADFIRKLIKCTLNYILTNKENEFSRSYLNNTVRGVVTT